MADAIKEEHPGAQVELVPGGRGEFTVWLGEACLAKKTFMGFPSEEEVLLAMRQSLAAAK